MADNVTLDSGSGGAVVACDETTYSGDTAVVPLTRLVHVSGSEGSKTVSEILFAEDAQHTSGDYGLQMLAVRNDTLAALATTDGDYTPLQVNASGALYVQEGSALDVSAATVTVDNGGTFAVQVDGNALTALQLIDDPVFADDAAFTPGTSKVMMVGAEFDDSTPDSVDEGDAGAIRMSANRNLYVRIRDDAGNERGLNVDANGEVGVTLANATLPDTASGDLAAINSAVSGTVSVSGTVTANLGTTDNTVLDNIDTQTSPAASFYRNIDANAEAAIKASAGTLFWIHVMNLGSAVAYVHLYDDTTGNVNPGTTTPDLTLPIPTQGDTNGAGFVLSFGANGQAFGTAITLVVTTTTDGSAGDPGTNVCFVNAGYT